MKKILLFITTFVLCFILAGAKQVSAASEQDPTLVSTTTETLEDGSYIVTEIYATTTNQNSRSNLYNKEGEKVMTKYSALNTVLWVYTLSASFVVDEGVSAVCSSAGYNYDTRDSAWRFSDGEASWRENYARGVGKYKLMALGITIQTIDIDLILVCDKYGNLE